MSDKKKRQNTLKPPCKYGSDCYQKNLQHQLQYSHPSPKPSKKEVLVTTAVKEPKKSPKVSTRKKIAGDISGNPTATPVKETLTVKGEKNTRSPRKSPKKHTISPTRDESACCEIESVKHPNGDRQLKAPADVVADIKNMFLVEMPPDFYDLWEFSCSLGSKDPSEAFSDVGLHLVGPYDVLAKKISKKDVKGDNILCHYRYYYDPPEFQTVLIRDGDDWYHIGYFRDDPSEMPFGLASNSAAVGPKLNLVGDNIFAAINSEMKSALAKCDSSVTKKKIVKVQKDLEKFARENSYSLEVSTEKTKQRNKRINAKTFHELGIVVPYDKTRELGYRSLSVTNAKLKQILTRISNGPTEEHKIKLRSSLDEIMTNIQFANDECDYGTGLELGIDLFCFGDPYFHKDILQLLKLAYDLLCRSDYGRIIEAHLSCREKTDKVSVKDLIKT